MVILPSHPPDELPPHLNPRRRPPRRRRRVAAIVSVLLVVGVTLGLAVALVVASLVPASLRGEDGDDAAAPPVAGTQRPSPTGPSPTASGLAATPTSPSPSQPAGPLPLSQVTSFDPQADGTAHDDEVPLAHDGDPATAWTTQRYTTSAFGNLKDGVGLLVDLGRPLAVGEVRLRMAPAGGGVEIRAGETPEALAVRAAASDTATDLTLRPEGGPARYWVVWLTSLPPADGGGYRGGVAEMTFVG